MFGNTPAKRRAWWLERLHLLNGRWHLVDLDTEEFPGTDANFRSWAYQMAEQVGVKVKVTRSKQSWRTFGVEAVYRYPGEHPLEFNWLGPAPPAPSRRQAELAAQFEAELAHEAALLADVCTCGSDGSTPHPPSCKVWG